MIRLGLVQGLSVDIGAYLIYWGRDSNDLSVEVLLRAHVLIVLHKVNVVEVRPYIPLGGPTLIFVFNLLRLFSIPFFAFFNNSVLFTALTVFLFFVFARVSPLPLFLFAESDSLPWLLLLYSKHLKVFPCFGVQFANDGSSWRALNDVTMLYDRDRFLFDTMRYVLGR